MADRTIAKPRSWDRVRRRGRETLALVGVVTRVKDWRLLQHEHWYRIPVRTAPEGLELVKYLAFYQTSVFGPEKWAVNYYAPVLGMEVVWRMELLPDELRDPNAGEEYYRIDIGELQRLPNPIPSRLWRRIVFIPTTLERLLRAQEINDLFEVSPIEDRLYDAMREARLPAERQYFVREQETGFMLDMALFCSDGGVDIECDGEAYHSGKEKADQDRGRDNVLTAAGWRILRFSGKEITGNAESCVKMVRRTIKRLGGIEGRKGKAGPEPEGG